MENRHGKGCERHDRSTEADLIPNLVNTVKAFTDHENEVFSEVTEAREHLLAAGSMAEKSEADQGADR